MTAIDETKTSKTTSLVNFGCLTTVGLGDTIAFEIYEISSGTLGITTATPLSINQKLLWRVRDTEAPLIVHQNAGVDDPSKDTRRYRLIALDPELHFERLLPESRARTLGFHSRYQIRSARFPAVNAPLVLANTFGTRQAFKFRALNASKSGLLLESLPGSDAPFQIGTLLEVKIPGDDLGCIQCLAKVIRIDREKRCFGINLSDLQPEQKEKFQTFLELLEIHYNRESLKQLNWGNSLAATKQA